MKKLFTLLTLALLSIGTAWADAVTIGLTQANDNTEVIVSGTTYKGTLSAASYSGTTNLTVAEAHGDGCGINQGARATYKDGDAYYASKAFRKTITSSTWDATEWVGYTIVVASGYKMSLTNVKATMWDCSNTSYTWRVLITENDGTALYTSGNKTTSQASSGTLSVATPTGVSDLPAGTYYVKLQMYQNGGNKYFTVPYLTVDATVEEDNSTTYTVTTSAGDGGNVSPSGPQSVIEGNNFTVTATPNTGYGFLNWTVDGVENASTNNPYTFNNVTANHTIAAVFKQLYSVSYNVASENKGSSTNVLTTEYANVSDKWTAATNYYVAKEGYTLTKWNDGVNDYTPGTEYTLAGNITIAPVYTANVKFLDELTAATTISWPFATDNGAPTLSSEGNTQYYVKQTTIAGNTVDVPIFVNTEQDYGISGKKGKFVGNATNCQVNAGTVFKIPAIKGMVVKYMTSQTTAVSNIGFTDDTNDLGGDGSALTNPTVISNDNKTISYTYTGTADYLYLVDIAGGKYPTGISVTYPEKQTKYFAPTITVGDFNFTNHTYPVTITAAEGTLEVSTDGTNYTPETSPYQVNVTSTTHFYAKATGASFDDSNIVDEEVVCTFDNAKKYVAWVYESNYANAPSNYNIANDNIHTAMAAIYNVVDVDIKDYKSTITNEQKTALNGNLDDADLVLISEAVAGNGKGTIALKDIVGSVPMLSMKLFSYSSGRWDWGTPKNADKAVVAITPASKNYKVLEGVTFNGDDIELFVYPNEQNHIQYVDSWSNEPAGDVVLATTSSKPAMHASTSQKYFALGLSCDDFTKYHTNTVTIVKNAAAMLIAGEALDTEVATVGTIAERNYATYVTANKLDFSAAEGITAYIATGLNGAKDAVVLQEVDIVPVGTPIIVKTDTKGATVNVPVTTADASDVSANKLIAGDGSTAATEEYYYLANDLFHQANAGTLQSGKAYLHITTSAPVLNFVLGDVTGIGEIKTQKIESGQFFDLQGRKVAQPTKGLYIVNGKKIVIK